MAAKEMFERSRARIFEEYNCKLSNLLNDDKFATAVAYSSEALASDIIKHDHSDKKESFTNLDKGIYNYATRFVSKANPFYNYAEISFDRSTGIDVDDSIEVVLDVANIFCAERYVLYTTPLEEQNLLYAENFIIDGDKITFLTHSGIVDVTKLVTLEYGPVINSVTTFFVEDQRRENSVGDLVEYLQNRHSCISRQRLIDYLDFLISQRILVRYVIRNLNSFHKDIRGYGQEYEEEADVYNRYHLKVFSNKELYDIQKNKDTIFSKRLTEYLPQKTFYYINSFYKHEVSLKERHLYDCISQYLRVLKPFYSISHNFTQSRFVIVSLLKEYFAKHERSSVSYVELVAYLARNKMEIIDEEREDKYGRLEVTREKKTRIEYLNRLSGVLDFREIDDIKRELHLQETDKRICFNGPLDFNTGAYYITNIWAGNGKYLSRYLIGRRNGYGIHDDTYEHVQFYEPYLSTLNYTITPYETGTSLNMRYKHHFKKWLYPGDILLELNDNCVEYRNRRTNRKVKIHYLGFLPADSLPLKYGLLLFDDISYYTNVFDRDKPEEMADEINFKPGLRFEAVCLRRDRWYVRKDAIPLANDWSERIFDFTYDFYSWMASNLNVDTEHSYYKVHDKRKRYGHKPKYLDLKNPLSVFAFAKSISNLKGDMIISFEKMQPAPESLYAHRQNRYVTETMLEV